MTGKRALADAEHRDQAVARRDGTVFVEAGAGSGKTTVLVGRVLGLVDAGVPMSAIAAITFTERAGAELRDRLRRALTDRRDTAHDPLDAARWAGALDELDQAAIGTVHAFAQRILATNALAAGLPARFEVLDEASSALAFERRWRQVATIVFDERDLPPGGGGTADDLAEAVTIVLAAGVSPSQLRQLARVLDDAWDLARTRLQTPAPMTPLRLDGVVAQLRALVDLAGTCIVPDDKLAVHLRRLGPLADEVAVAPDDAARVALLAGLKITNKNLGQKLNWTRAGGKEAVHAELAATEAHIADVVDEHLRRALDQVTYAVAQAVVAAARERFTEGRLEFHDLLVGARDLLRYAADALAVRAALHQQYQAVLVDEFQDTDPLQLEIVELITADPTVPVDPADHGRGAARMRPADGRLFLVGDPKQSIYRFRRADLALYLRARRELGPPLALTSNFRSGPTIVAWINAVFAALVREQPGSQAAYERLDAARTDTPAGPAVVTFGRVHDDAPVADELRRREAADVATLIANAVAQGWQVGQAGGAPRPLRWADIAILLPSRTALAEIDAALTAHGIPSRIESGTLLWSAPEVAELLAVLHAACAPTDPLKVVTALRTSLLGCSDADLYRHRVLRGGGFAPTAPSESDDPGGADDPVAAALRALHEWSALAAWASPPVVVARVLDDTRAEALTALTPRPREPLRRLRLAQEQARAFADATGGTTAAWLAWIDRQRLDGTRVAEPLLTETDDDAVRILTIHAAKGLEFPMVVVAGLTTRPGGRPKSLQVLWPADGGPPETRLGPHVTSAGFDEAADIETLLDADERIRLLYVACTRARDHLGVSLHHLPRSRDDGGSDQLTLAAVLASAAGRASRFAEPLGPPALALAPPAPPLPVATAALSWTPLEPPPVTTVSATTLAGHGEGDHPSVLHVAGEALVSAEDASAAEDGRVADPAKRKAATTLGTAVHWVLEHVDLGAPAGLERLATAALAALGPAADATVDAALVAELAAVTLRAPTVAAAATSEHWRELYVAVPGVGGQLEGYIDLVVRTPAGLVVVDFKTDAIVPAGDAPAPAHRLQLAAYAHALAAATGETVAGAVAVYCRDDERPERAVPDLADAVGEIVALLDDVTEPDATPAA